MNFPIWCRGNYYFYFEAMTQCFYDMWMIIPFPLPFYKKGNILRLLNIPFPKTNTLPTPFLFLCVFWGISPRRRTQWDYAGGPPQSNMFPCSHGNISLLWNGKEARKSKESLVYIRGGSHTHGFSWGLRTTTSSSRPLELLPPSREHTCTRRTTSPTT